jgi:hypothetical protein
MRFISTDALRAFGRENIYRRLLQAPRNGWLSDAMKQVTGWRVEPQRMSRLCFTMCGIIVEVRIKVKSSGYAAGLVQSPGGKPPGPIVSVVLAAQRR